MNYVPPSPYHVRLDAWTASAEKETQRDCGKTGDVIDVYSYLPATSMICPVGFEMIPADRKPQIHTLMTWGDLCQSWNTMDPLVAALAEGPPG